MGSGTPRGRRRRGIFGGGDLEGGKGGGRKRHNCREEGEGEGRRQIQGKDRGGELEEWLELYLTQGGSRLRDANSERRVAMLAEAMANIDQTWFGGLR